MSILISSLVFCLTLWVSFGLAVDWNFMYSFRNRWPFFNRKPFTCAACLSFWLCLKALAVGWALGGVELVWVGAMPIFTYLVAKQIDNFTNPFQ